MVTTEITHQVSFQAGISYKKFGNFIAIRIQESVQNIYLFSISLINVQPFRNTNITLILYTKLCT